MKRFHLVEFEDFEKFPSAVRDGITDYLRFFIGFFKLYSPVPIILNDLIGKTGEAGILDLCSGGGGEIIHIIKELDDISGKKYKITLCDKFPNLKSFNYLNKITGDRIDFLEYPVDTLCVPSDLKGVRTIFSSFHHFDKETGKKVLSDAVRNNAPIAIFDAAERKWLYIIGVFFSTPFMQPLSALFIRPFKISRLFFTFIIPLIPFFALWDGIVSMLRIYSPDELLQMTSELEKNNYIWKTGLLTNKIHTKVTYLIGYPQKL